MANILLMQASIHFQFFVSQIIFHIIQRTNEKESQNVFPVQKQAVTLFLIFVSLHESERLVTGLWQYSI